MRASASASSLLPAHRVCNPGCLGLLPSCSQNQVQALVDTARCRQGMGWGHSSTGKLCLYVFPIHMPGWNLQKGCPNLDGNPSTTAFRGA